MAKYTLIITEKPDAAKRIATALDTKGKPKKTQCSGVPYYEAYNNGNLVIVPALGHLYSIVSKQKKRDYPVFDYQWVPLHLADRKAPRIRTWLSVISKLAQDADGFVDACDYDIEGSIIGYSILKYACSGKEKTAKRMKYSTLTDEELQESYANLLPTLDFALVEAGLTRHEVDWLYGINLSRALTQAVKSSSGQYATISTGRVQGPTLKFLDKREKTIRCFIPTPYWTLTAKIEIDSFTFETQYKKPLDTLVEATMLKDICKAREGQIQSVETTDIVQNPPVPFDLTTLQSEAYRVFRYTPVRTSSILQHLYLDALISYPRTSSQRLPPSIGYKNILKKLAQAAHYSRQSIELLAKPTLKPNEGKKVDPAHPAIYPTGNLPRKPLGTAEQNVFDLIVKRFLAVFSEPAILQNVTVAVSINDNPFTFAAVRTLKEGWVRFYQPYAIVRNDELPALIKGQKVKVKRVTLNNNFTKPPPRYNPRSLLLKMEKEEIGTKATRAATIQTLQDRNYTSGTDILSISDLGFEVMEVLSKHCPRVVSPEMTKKLEQEMEDIQLGNRTKISVLIDAMETLKTVTTELKDKEATVGSQLSAAIQKARIEERTVGICSKCGGELIILRSKKTSKRFVGCSNYFKGKCSTAYPLPQTGIIKPLRINCKNCGAPTIAVYSRGRKAWRLCLNPQCPAKRGKTK
ncbi:MAG: DNA topoisomerase I [Betaproteobacteria bacterium]